MVEDRVTAESSDSFLGSAVLTQLPYQLLKRTQAQLELARRVTSLLTCSNTHTKESSPESPQIEVTPLVDSAPQESTSENVSAETHDTSEAVQPAVASPQESAAPQVHESRPGITEDALPLASYDSLSASQVVPRLALMSSDELLIIQQYERENRHRQTILNRCQQLLDEV